VLPVFQRPLAARVERKLNMSCIYSSACVYGLTALTVAIWSIPLLFVIWRWVKAPIRIRDLVFLGLLGLIFLIQGVSALIGPNVMMGLIYILAGAAK
jgi:ABC-type transport system involved in cytochrome c biogenesis permease subunit